MSGILFLASYGNKTGVVEGLGQLLSGGKVEGRSLVDLLGLTLGTEVGPCYGM